MLWYEHFNTAWFNPNWTNIHVIHTNTIKTNPVLNQSTRSRPMIWGVDWPITCWQMTATCDKMKGFTFSPYVKSTNKGSCSHCTCNPSMEYLQMFRVYYELCQDITTMQDDQIALWKWQSRVFDSTSHSEYSPCSSKKGVMEGVYPWAVSYFSLMLKFLLQNSILEPRWANRLQHRQALAWSKDLTMKPLP